VASLGSENQNLITTNNLQQAEINDKAAQIETKNKNFLYWKKKSSKFKYRVK